MADDTFARAPAEFERQHDVPADRYCGLTPADMSRAIVAYHGGPRRPDAPIGYWPVGEPATRLGWLREEFGPEADVARIRLLEQAFSARLDRLLALDWMLPAAEFGRAVSEGLERHVPELTADARRVIAGNYGYSHAR